MPATCTATKSVVPSELGLHLHLPDAVLIVMPLLVCVGQQCKQCLFVPEVLCASGLMSTAQSHRLLPLDLLLVSRTNYMLSTPRSLVRHLCHSSHLSSSFVQGYTG